MAIDGSQCGVIKGEVSLEVHQLKDIPMKKIAVILLAALLIPVTMTHAGSHGGKGKFMKMMVHANPVPNYVAVIKRNSEALGLTKEQIGQVMAWKKANSEKMHEMVMSVVAGEKKMKEASMTGVAAEKIMEMAKEVHKTRLDIIAGKTSCRDRMMQILNKEQWTKLTGMVAGK